MEITKNTRVIKHNEAGDGLDIGSAGDIFGSDQARKMTVGSSMGEDYSRGVYDWWLVTLDGKDIGELRDDASGLTLHIQG